MSIRIHSWFSGLLGALLCATPVVAEDAPPPEIGLRIGERAPDFGLKDQNGKEVSLESMLKKGPVAVVFYRSADWCLFCKFELKNFQHRLKDFEDAGGQVVGVSYDSIAILKRFAKSQAITFPLLSDQASKTIDAYRVRDSTPSAKSGFATHASLVVDQTGVVRAKFLGVIYDEEPGMGILLKGIKESRNPQPKTTKDG